MSALAEIQLSTNRQICWNKIRNTNSNASGHRVPDGCALWQNAHSERGASLCTFRFKKQHEAESGYVAYHREQNVHEWNFIGFGGTGARGEGFVLLVGMRPSLPENWQTGG